MPYGKPTKLFSKLIFKTRHHKESTYLQRTTSQMSMGRNLTLITPQIAPPLLFLGLQVEQERSRIRLQAFWLLIAIWAFASHPEEVHQKNCRREKMSPVGSAFLLSNSKMKWLRFRLLISCTRISGISFSVVNIFYVSSVEKCLNVIYIQATKRL